MLFHTRFMQQEKENEKLRRSKRPFCTERTLQLSKNEICVIRFSRILQPELNAALAYANYSER